MTAPSPPSSPASGPGPSPWRQRRSSETAAADPAPAPRSKVPAHEVSSTGLSPRVAGVLCYAAGWASGLVILSMERESRFVRFHAYQAVVALGGLTVIALMCWGLTIVMAFIAPPAFRVMAIVTQIAWLALVVTWLFAVVEVSQGKVRKLPLVGKRAERVAATLPER